MQQTAVAAAGEDAPPGANTSEAFSRPQLHNLSIEHASIALALTSRELQLVELIGAGLVASQIAKRLEVASCTATTYVRDLKSKTRMNKLELAIMGYQLRGQVPQN